MQMTPALTALEVENLVVSVDLLRAEINAMAEAASLAGNDNKLTRAIRADVQLDRAVRQIEKGHFLLALDITKAVSRMVTR